MEKFFTKCNTLTELQQERQHLLAEINKEYADASKRITTGVLPYKRLPIYKLSEHDSEIKTFVSFPLLPDKAKPSEIILTAGGVSI